MPPHDPSALEMNGNVPMVPVKLANQLSIMTDGFAAHENVVRVSALTEIAVSGIVSPPLDVNAVNARVVEYPLDDHFQSWIMKGSDSHVTVVLVAAAVVLGSVRDDGALIVVKPRSVCAIETNAQSGSVVVAYR